jgi:hypothetical protein
MFCKPEGYGSANAIYNFICSLSDHHKERLFEYINKQIF